MADYALAWDAVHAPLMKELDMPKVRPEKFAKNATSRSLLTDVNAGRRKLDWCPADMSLEYHLFPFFAQRKVEVVASPELESLFGRVRTQEDVWVVSSERGLYRNEEDHRRSIPASGFFDRLVVPDAVQLTYLVVMTLYRPHLKVAIASQPDGPLLFARTATCDYRGWVVGVAYMPGKSIQYRAFIPNLDHPELVVMDAFILT